MVNAKSVTQQLRQIGSDYAVWGRSEIRELASILIEDEKIMQAVNGYYDGGFALICTTNYRVLIIDKKPFTLTVEDLRYDMIVEVDFSSRFFTSILHIFTPMRTLIFTSWSMGKLRKSMDYIQQRVMELRNNEFMAAQFAAGRVDGARQVALQAVVAKKRAAGARGFQRQPELALVAEKQNRQAATDDVYQLQPKIINPYTRVPLLSRRRKYPSFY